MKNHPSIYWLLSFLSITSLTGCDSSDSITADTSQSLITDTDYDLDSTVAPSDNFELIDWHLNVPTDTDGNGYADSVKEQALSDDYESEYFYTGDDGYSASDNYMYYKAGAYNQSKSGDDDDYVQVTFYSLSNTHKNYAY